MMWRKMRWSAYGSQPSHVPSANAVAENVTPSSRHSAIHVRRRARTAEESGRSDGETAQGKARDGDRAEKALQHAVAPGRRQPFAHFERREQLALLNQPQRGQERQTVAPRRRKR